METLKLFDMRGLRRHLGRGEACLACVSGGADSVCLLHGLHSATTELGATIEVVHVNHLVRGMEAQADAEFVGRICAELGVAYHYREIPPLSRKPQGHTTEEYFREERYRAIFEVARERNITRIALGHNADDLAETMIMHLIRGTGLRGLSFRFCQKREGFKLLRPLWQTPRSRILRALKSRDIGFREDSSNESMDFTRNRVRHVLIPMLKRDFNPSVGEALRRTSRVLSLASHYLRSVARSRLRAFARMTGDRRALPLRPFNSMPEVLRLETAREWVRRCLGERVGVSSEHVEAIVRLARPGRGQTIRSLGGTTIARTRNSLILIEAGQTGDAEASGQSLDWFAREELARRHLRQHPGLPLARIEQPVTIVSFDENGFFNVDLGMLDKRNLHLRVSSILQQHIPLGGAEGVAEAGLFQPPLIIRNRKPGDRASQSVRLKSVLINEKVPYFVRDYLVLLTDSRGRVLVVVGLDRVTKRIQRHYDQHAVVEFEIRH